MVLFFLHDLVSPGDKRKSQNRIFGFVSSTTFPWPCCVFKAVSAVTIADFTTFLVDVVSFAFSSFVDEE